MHLGSSSGKYFGALSFKMDLDIEAQSGFMALIQVS
jgi:hypothetical protein